MYIKSRLIDSKIPNTINCIERQKFPEFCPSGSGNFIKDTEYTVVSKCLSKAADLMPQMQATHDNEAKIRFAPPNKVDRF